MLSRFLVRLLRFAFHHFYNRFAFTYDFVAAVVSRGDWIAWTRAALPFVHGPRVLEIAVGTGNLHRALNERANFATVGVDLSPYMIELTRNKFARDGRIAHLAQASAQTLPFASNFFDDVIVTFPAPFIMQDETQAEIARVLKADGQLLWVDGGRVKPIDVWSRFLNWALNFTSRESDSETLARKLPRPRFDWRVERVEFVGSVVFVIQGRKVNE